MQEAFKRFQAAAQRLQANINWQIHWGKNNGGLGRVNPLGYLNTGSFSFFISGLGEASVWGCFEAWSWPNPFQLLAAFGQQEVVLLCLKKKKHVFLWYTLFSIGLLLFGYRLPREIFHRATRIKPPSVRESSQATVLAGNSCFSVFCVR